MTESTATFANHLSSVEQETAAALLAIIGGAPASAHSAFEELARRNKALLDGGDHAILEALARQVTLLEAVIVSLFKDAASAKDENVTRMALSGAFSAQRNLVQVLGAIHQVRHRG